MNPQVHICHPGFRLRQELERFISGKGLTVPSPRLYPQTGTAPVASRMLYKCDGQGGPGAWSELWRSGLWLLPLLMSLCGESPDLIHGQLLRLQALSPGHSAPQRPLKPSHLYPHCPHLLQLSTLEVFAWVQSSQNQGSPVGWVSAFGLTPLHPSLPFLLGCWSFFPLPPCPPIRLGMQERRSLEAQGLSSLSSSCAGSAQVPLTHRLGPARL